MTARVTVLKEGTIHREDDGTILDASSSVTLLRDGEETIVVDTAMPHDGPELLAALEGEGLSTEDVTMVVNTHGHHDHTGCNRLFEAATVVVHRLEGAPRSGPGVEVRRIDGDADLAPSVRAIETPGHSRGHISVLAETDSGPWVMAGDALPTLDNYLLWVPPGINYDPLVALRSMKRIIDLAKWIVPGHDRPFEHGGELRPGSASLMSV